MKKDLGVKPYVFPMPVLMIATYGENDKVEYGLGRNLFKQYGGIKYK